MVKKTKTFQSSLETTFYDLIISICEIKYDGEKWSGKSDGNLWTVPMHSVARGLTLSSVHSNASFSSLVKGWLGIAFGKFI